MVLNKSILLNEVFLATWPENEICIHVTFIAHNIHPANNLLLPCDISWNFGMGNVGKRESEANNKAQGHGQHDRPIEKFGN